MKKTNPTVLGYWYGTPHEGSRYVNIDDSLDGISLGLFKSSNDVKLDGLFDVI